MSVLQVGRMKAVCAGLMLAAALGNYQVRTGCPRQMKKSCDCRMSRHIPHLELSCPSNKSSPLVGVLVLSTNVTVTCFNYSQEAFSALEGFSLAKFGLQVASLVDCPPPRNSYGDLLSGMNISYSSMLLVSGLRKGERLEGRHFSGLEWLTWLSVTDSGVTSLPGDLLSKLPGLIHINISNNALSSLPRGLFWPARKLYTITISEKALTILDPDVFTDQLDKIHVIHLDGCSLSALSRRDIEPLHHVDTISIQSNLLVELDPDLFIIHKTLLFLFLNGNLLKAVPEGLLRNCVRLMRLDLSYNRLEHLPPAMFKNNPNLLTLEINNNRLTTLSGSLFLGMTRLQRLTLNNNSLVEVDDRTFDSLYNLQALDMSFNNLTDATPIFQLLKFKVLAVMFLRLEGNKLTRLSDEALRLLAQSEKLQYIGLYNNPWICDCQALTLAVFLHNNVRIVTQQDIRCDDGSLVLELKESEVCPSQLVKWAIVGGVMAGLGLVTLTITTLYYKYTQEVKVWLYAHRLCSCWLSEEELDKDKKYDAFVSYASQEQDFVEEELIPVLEDEHGYKLCLHYRDWPVGDFIATQIVRSVRESKRTIVVLSNSFVKSVWGKMELRTAHAEALGEGRVKVLVILYEELEEGLELLPELRAYLLSRTYINWGHPSFWQRLIRALPPQPQS